MKTCMFDGKRVCIVGPANYLERMNYADHIESYDIIVRFLRSLPVPDRIKPHVGERTDVVASSLICIRGVELHDGKDSRDLRLIRDNGNVVLAPIYADGYKGLQWGKLIENEVPRQVSAILSFSPSTTILQVDGKYFMKYKQELGTNPSTGIAAICHLLYYPLAELHVTGFTLDVTACDYTPEYLNRCNAKNIGDGNGWHNGQKEVRFFKILISRDPRISFDDYIRKNVL